MSFSVFQHYGLLIAMGLQHSPQIIQNVNKWNHDYVHGSTPWELSMECFFFFFFKLILFKETYYAHFH